MFFVFGQIIVQIIGDETLTGVFRSKWKKYLYTPDKTQESIRLLFEELAVLNDETCDNGWYPRVINGEKAIAFFQDGRPLFALQHHPLQKLVKVLIPQDRKGNVFLGAQYGLMLSLCQDCIGLHGVTVLCNNEIIILSAPSGTGKSTLSKLLERYCDAIEINGDFALLRLTEDGVIFEPTPFCGTSGRSLNHRFRVDRVVFLSQAKENEWCVLNGREAMKMFMDNTFIPTWDRNMQESVKENILKCISNVKVNMYSFAPTQEAAEKVSMQLGFHDENHHKDY